MNKKVKYLIAALFVTVVIIVVLILATVSGNSNSDVNNQPEEKKLEEKKDESSKQNNNKEKVDKKKKDKNDEKKKKDVLTYKNVVETKTIDYETIVQEDPNSKVGTQEVIRSGSDGKETTIKLITLKNGEEIDSKVIGTYISKSPINEIVSEGTLDGPLVFEKQETKIEEIEYDTINQDDPNLEIGKVLIQTEGESGEKRITYKIIYHDGEENSREIISEEVIKEPVDEILLVGTKEGTPEVPETNSDKVFDNEEDATAWAEAEIKKEDSEWFNYKFNVIKYEKADGSFKYLVNFVQ